MDNERTEEVSLDLNLDGAEAQDLDVETESSPGSEDAGSRPDADEAFLDDLKASGLDDDEGEASTDEEVVEEEPEATEEEVVEEQEEEQEEQEEVEETSDPDPDAAETEESTEGEAEGAGADSPGDEEARIPYSRLQEVVRQKNEYKNDAETMRTIRKVAEDKGWGSDALQQGIEMLLTFKDNPAKYRDTIAAMAEVAGLQVSAAMPEDIATAVEEGEISESYAKKLAAQRQAIAVQQTESVVPSLEDRGYTVEQAQEDLKTVAEDFRTRYPGLFSQADIAKEAQDKFAQEIERLEAETGNPVSLERQPAIASRICQAVVNRHTQKPVKPNARPLSVKKPAKRVRSADPDSLESILDDPDMKAAFGN